jgi:hypothetical protein
LTRSRYLWLGALSSGSGSRLYRSARPGNASFRRRVAAACGLNLPVFIPLAFLFLRPGSKVLNQAENRRGTWNDQRSNITPTKIRPGFKRTGSDTDAVSTASSRNWQLAAFHREFRLTRPSLDLLIIMEGTGWPAVSKNIQALPSETICLPANVPFDDDCYQG